MHDSGLGYRRIAKRLRNINIKTARGSVFKNTNVFSVIKGMKSDRYVLEKNVIVSMSINGEKCI